MNLNVFAREITMIEGKKKSISIAQVKEVIKILGERWENMPIEDVNIEVQMIIRGG
jgi:hypothetical protein